MKTELTKQLERQIWNAMAKMGTFLCSEVTIGFGGKERVDMLSYNTKGEWRSYEIKVSKSDFHSKCKNSFISNFNYYVLTKELYEQVKDEIPSHIGVYIGDYSIKKAKRQELTIDENILKSSMIRSLYREVEKQFKSGDESEIAKLNRSVSRYKSERNKYRKLYEDLNNKKYENEINQIKKEIKHEIF